MKRNYKFVISFDGTKYLGWEHQMGTDMTIQGKLEGVLSKMVNSEVELIGAGRTDAGVHALNFIFNSFLDTKLSEVKIKDYCNKYLPEDICVKDVKIAGDRFHARYNATGKTYRYTCYCGKEKPIFDRKYVYCLDGVPDINKMVRASEFLIGEHDFASFAANPKMKKSTVRTVDKIEIKKNGDYITFTYHGNGFLQHMVRILTGTLLEAGFGKRNPLDFPELIRRKDRKLAGETAPALGLCLVEVDYC